MRGSATRPGRRRLLSLAALLAGVLVMHGCVIETVFETLAASDAARAMPRIEVAYVRDMVLSTPPPVAPAGPTAAPPAAALAPTLRARAAKPALIASAAPAAVAKPAAEPASEAASAALRDPVLAQAPEATAAESAAFADEDSDDIGESLTLPRERAARAASAASAGVSTSAAPAFEWPLSTRISYRLTGNYRGEVNGTAQVEWIRAADRYQVHLDLVVGASFAPLITRRMSSDGTISAAGLVPRRYDQDTKVMLRARQQVALRFEADSVVLANGERRPTLRGVQDTASQFVQLTYVFSTRPDLLRIGGSVEIPLALPHKVDVWTYDVVAEETLQTPFGPLASVHLKPRRSAPPKLGELSAEIWFAPQLRYLPVRIRIHQDEQTFIDLMIDKRPEQGG